MAVPVLVAIGGILATVLSVLKEFRKTVAMIIAAVIWALFTWLIVWYVGRLTTVFSELGEAHDGASVSGLSSLVSWFDKVEYMFPIYTAFSALALYSSVRFSVLFVKWLMRAWDSVPFKGSAGS